jgi:hypothetical protein
MVEDAKRALAECAASILGEQDDHLKDAVRRLLRATTPFPSALEGDPYALDVDLEQIWHELAGMVGYDPNGEEADKP